MTPHSCRPKLILSLLFLGIAWACIAPIRAESPGPDCTFIDHTVHAERLRALEDQLLPAPLREGPRSHSTLPDYYWAANRALASRLQRIHNRRRAGAPVRSVTLVSGTAGIGKTFIKNEVIDDSIPKSKRFKADFRELYASWAKDGTTTLKADLCDGELALNGMLRVADHAKNHILDFLEAHDADFYVLDSLDEIHPDDYQWVLRQVVDFVASRKNRFVHVVVFGRDVAFQDFWRSNRNKSSLVDINLHVLNPPRFVTTGDLLVSSWNYDSWKHKLRLRLQGEQTSFKLEEYVDWAHAGYSYEGRFATVTPRFNQDAHVRARNTLIDWAKQHRVVSNTLTNLAGNAMTREIVARMTRDNLVSYNEDRFMRDFMRAWMIRNMQQDDRPSVDKPIYHELYLELLRQVAVRYAGPDELDDSGFFHVAEDASIMVPLNGNQHRFRVRDILDRSGMKIVDLGATEAGRYRFEPFWFHRLLVEMHNQKIASAR